MMMRRRMIGVAALACSITGPTNLSAQTPNDSTQVAQVVHDYIVGWRNGDLELLAQVFDPELVLYKFDRGWRMVTKTLVVR